MIDHCEASRKAISALGLRYLLCDWHAYQNIGKRIKRTFRREPEDVQKEVYMLTKLIQRARDEEKAEEIIGSLKDISSVADKYTSYLEANYIAGDWAPAFCDRLRTDSREGLFNTNNASETFFRTLLRKYVCLSIDLM